MNPISYSSVGVFFLFLVGGMLVQPSQAFDFGWMKDIGSAACGLVVGASQLVPCTNEFHHSVKPFILQDGNIPSPVYCCAATTLRYCVTDKIQKKCGSASESDVNEVISGIVASVKAASGGIPCNGNEFYYRKESPLCWPVWGHATGAGLLALLILTICCLCCKACSRKSNKKSRPVIVNLLPTTNPTSTSPPYTRLHEGTTSQY